VVTTVIAVTGSEGFIGRHVVASLVRMPGIDVIRVARPSGDPAPIAGSRIVKADILAESTQHPLAGLQVDTLVHLSWNGLSDFRSGIHHEQVIAHRRFLAGAVDVGVQRIVCAGTCLEYGLQEGELDEEDPIRPTVAYSEAKARLRDQFIEEAERARVGWAWGRIYYPFGPGQHARSLWTSLQLAIDRGDVTFPMSPGLQVRDYLQVEEVGSIFARLAVAEASGTFNVCSGNPVVLRDLVEGWARARGSDIRPEYGVYDYPDYEPMRFWGSRRRLDAVLATLGRST
jgi:dTDP-6-deoxy-L-talose 4-dehydrogenase (NAD+)